MKKLYTLLLGLMLLSVSTSLARSVFTESKISNSKAIGACLYSLQKVIETKKTWVEGTSSSAVLNNCTLMDQSLPTNQFINNVDFLNTNFGLAVGLGYSIYRTTNGGDNWTEIQLTGDFFGHFDVDIIDNNTAWLCGHSGLIQRTTNGGLNWTTVNIGVSDHIYNIEFVDAQLGYFITQFGELYKTTNGGVNWQSVASIPNTGVGSYTEFEIRNGVLLVGANNGLIMRSADEGNTWTVLSTGISGYVRGITGISSSIYWACGNNGQIRVSFNTGASWTDQMFPGTANLTDIVFSSFSDGWTCDVNGEIYCTTDGGNTWVTTNTGITNQLGDLFYLDDEHIWSNGSDGGIFLLNCASTACTHPDYDALMALYNSTDGPNWTNNSGWADGAAGTNCDPCGWYGIGCDGDERVTSINMSGSNGIEGNNLTGTIPFEISDISQLEQLNLSHNLLSGSIPVSLSSLSSLEGLNLSNNSLQENLPISISQLSNLIFLDLSYNQLTGSIPSDYEQLGSLLSLVLRSNNLSGQLPVEIFDLTNLLVFDIADNNFSGNIPTEIENLTSCNYLNLRNNLFEGILPTEIGSMSSLTQLFLHDNNLSGEIPNSIGSLTNLTILNLRRNNFSGFIPSEIGFLSSLTYLLLSDNLLSGEIPNEISNLTSAISIDLSSNDLNACIPEELSFFCGNDIIDTDNNRRLPWQGDFSQFCATDGSQTAQLGAPCNDGDPSTVNDIITADCGCAGAPIACFVEWDQNPVVGTCNGVGCNGLINVGFLVNGCSSLSSITSAQLDEFANDANGNGLISASEFVGEVSVIANIIDQGNGSYTFTGLFPVGLHAVEVIAMDDCGASCSAILTFEIQQSCTPPSISAVTTNDICLNGLDNIVDLTQYDDDLSAGNIINWYEDNLLNSPISDPTNYFFIGAPGINTLYVQAEDPTDPSCLSSVQAVEFDLNDLPSIAIVEIIGNFCAGEELEYVLEISGGEPPYSGGVAYDGQVFATFNNEFNTTVSVFVTFPSAGNYGYTNTPLFVSDVNQCPLGNGPLPFFEQEVFPLPIANSSPPLTACLSISGDASFNLTAAEDAITGNTGGQVNWYTDIGLSDPIGNPFDYSVSSDASVYAQVESTEGCLSEVVEVELLIEELTAPEAGQDQAVSIPGGNDGVAFVDITAGTPPFDLFYTNTDTGDSDGLLVNQTGTAFITNLTSGVYELIFTDNNGCEAITSFTINEPNCDLFVAINADFPAMACAGDTDNQLVLDVTSSFPLVDIEWSNPAWSGQTVVSNIGAGTYSVTVTDEADCVQSDMITITEPSGFSFACAGNPVTDDGPGSASVTIFAGETPPFMVSWTGSSTGNVTDLGYELVIIDNPTVASIYNVTITDANGCSDTCEIPVADISTPDCDHPDYTALLAFYNATNGASWTNNTGWIDGVAGTDCDPCSWFGITCDANDRVQALNLPGNNLVGILPPELGQFTTMTELVLTDNLLTGSLPSEIEFLTNITVVQLSNNDLSGSIPDEIQFWTAITDLRLDNNNFTGAIPSEFQFLNNLQTLYLNDNNFSDCYFESIDNLCDVGDYDFSNNPLLPWEGDFSQFCLGVPQLGADCDDGNPNTNNDRIQDPDCACAGDLVGNGVSFTLAELTTNQGENVCLPLTVNNFTNVLGMQFSVNYDPAILNYTGPQNITTNLPGFSATAIGSPGLGNITFTWNDPAAAGADLPENEVLTELCFTLTGNTDSPVVFSGDPIPIELIDGNEEQLVFNGENGAINIANTLGTTFQLPTVNTALDQNVCLPVTVDNFTNILAIQFSVNYDANVLSYTGTQNFNPALVGFTQASIGNPTPGNLTATWNDPFAAGVTFPTGATLFEVCFDTQNCGTGIVEFSGTPTPIEIVDGNEQDVLFIPINGQIEVPSTVSLSLVDVGGPTCGIPNNGFAEVLAENGTGPYNYTWSNGAITARPDNLTEGTYSVSVVDSRNCSAELESVIIPTGTNNLTLTCPDNLSLFIEADSTGILLEFPAPDAEACPLDSLRYTLSGAVTQGETLGVLPVTFFPVGITTVEYLVPGQDTCSFTVEVMQVMDPCSDFALLTNTIMSPTCGPDADGLVQLTITGGDGNYEYAWSNGASTEDLSMLTNGLYTLTVTDGNDCEVSGSFWLQAPDSLMATAIVVNDTEDAGGSGSVTLTISGGTGTLNITWNGYPDGPQVTTIIGPTTVSGLVTDDAGCTLPLSYEVLQLSEQATLNDPTCFDSSDGSITVTLSGGTEPYTYVWTQNGSPAIIGNSATVGNLAPGTYTATLTDSTGATLIRNYELNADPIVVNCAETTPATSNVLPDGAGTVTVLGGTEPYTITLNGAQVYTNVSAGNYNLTELLPDTYQVTITDANGCTQTCELTITGPDCNVAITELDEELCSGETYLFGGELLTASGSYTDTLLTDLGCDSIIQLDLTVFPTPTAQISGDTTFCPNDNLHLFTVLTDANIYAWSTGSTTPVVTIGSGLTTLSVTVTNNNGCTATDQVSIISGQAPDIQILGDTEVCGSQAAELTATGGQSYAWSDGTMTATATLPLGFHAVTVTTAVGCSGVELVEINSTPVPVLPPYTSAIVGCGAGTTPVLTLALEPGQTIDWYDSNGVLLITGQANYTPPGTGVYRAQLRDTASGCISNAAEFNYTEEDILPPVLENCPADLYVILNTAEEDAVIASWVPPTASDNCEIDELQTTALPGSAFSETTEVTYTATDLSGNSNDCTFSVVVEPTDPVTIYVDSAAVVVEDAIARIPVCVRDFTNVQGLQFSLHLADSSSSYFLSVDGINPDLENGIVEIMSPGDTLIQFLWVDDDGAPASVSLPDSTALFYINIALNGDNGDCVALNFVDTPLARAAVRTTVGEVVPSTAGGPVCLPALATIAGNIYREDELPVPNVEVRCINEDTTLLTYTDELGHYEFPGLLLGKLYEIIPSLNTNPTNGLALTDLTITQRYILGLLDLPSPYRLIAADVTNNGIISLTDLTTLSRVIIQIFPEFPNNTSWRFVDAEYIFPDPTNPWLEPFAERRTIEAFSKDSLSNNFIGIKIGDVNLSATVLFDDNTTGFIIPDHHFQFEPSLPWENHHRWTGENHSLKTPFTRGPFSQYWDPFLFGSMTNTKNNLTNDSSSLKRALIDKITNPN